MKYLIPLILLLTFTTFSAEWGKTPDGWDDYKVGLVNDHNIWFEEPMAAALDAGIQIDYKYAYITAGVDMTTNTCMNLFDFSHQEIWFVMLL